MAKYTLSVAVLCIVMSSFRAPLALISYELNKAYISQVLCVNKDDSAMQCNGKCHLKKQLQEANDTEKPAHKTLHNETNYNWMVQEYSIFIQNPVGHNIDLLCNYDDYISNGFAPMLERPPTS